MIARGRTAALVLALAACGQRGAALRGGQGVLSAPASLDFGTVYVGATIQRSATIGNSGTAQLALAVSVAGDPQLALAGPATVTLAAGGTAQVAVTVDAAALRPDQTGALHGSIQIAGDATAQIAITGQIAGDLDCPAGNPCHGEHFDPQQGACVTTTLPDGAACDDGDPCTTNKSCSGGACKGVAVSCDDGNVCTTDYCVPGQGCEHLDHSLQCQGQDPCQIYFCDPKEGCGSTAAVDGTPCSAEIPCVHASVCLAGQCTGAPLPDGTPCVAPQDPCARDATCKAGACDSPTADALVPGEVLWRLPASEWSDGDGGEIDAGPPDGGGYLPGWRAAAATDGLGDLYLDDDDADGGSVLVSLDVCGRERWRNPDSATSSIQWTNGRHLLANGLVLTVTAGQQIIAQSAVTGQLLWTFDLADQDVAARGAANFAIEDVALAQSGVLYFAADWIAPDGDGGTTLMRVLGGVLGNGQAKFIAPLPPLPQGAAGPYRFGYPLLVDENEELYTAMHLSSGSSEIESYDQTGAARWTLPVARDWLNSFSEDQGLFVEPVSLTAFDAQGRTIWSHVEPASAVQPTGHSPIVAQDGTVSLARIRYDPSDGGVAYHGVIEAYTAGGAPLWTYALPEGEAPQSSHVLDQNGRIYFATTAKRVIALDGRSGTLLWQTPLPTDGDVWNGVLALTPAGSLVVSTRRELFAVYGGAPLASSPWPRFRGGNDNRSSPSVPLPPSP